MNDVPSPALPAIGQRLQTLALGLLILVLVVYLLQTFALVLQQLFVAVFLAYLILPLHYSLTRRGFPLLLSAILIVGSTLLVCYALGLLIYNSLEDLTDKFPVYQKNIDRMLTDVASQFPGLDGPELRKILQGDTPDFGYNLETLRSALGNLFGFLSNAVVVLVYLGFLLAESWGFPRRLEKAFGADLMPQLFEVVGRINASISQYLLVKAAMGLVAGAFTALLLTLFGVDYALLWGVLAFLLNFIPYLGSLVAVVLPVLLSLVQLADLLSALVILACLLAVQNSLGYLIEPRIAGRRLDLSPLVILLALAFWGSLWGIVGMILAVPLVVVVKTVLENIPATRPIAVLLSNV